MAKAVPPCSMAMALGRSDAGTMRARIAVDNDQKPPTEIPIKARPIMKTRKFGAKVTARPETTSTAV
ncbi:hypothetical protein D3C71_2188330 [compost metagenome]